MTADGMEFHYAVITDKNTIEKKGSIMPIFEFKCSKCEEFFEVLVMNKDEDREIRCPKCKSHEFERVVSTTNYAMGNSSSAQGASKQERTCSTGSCTTYTVPGATRD